MHCQGTEDVTYRFFLLVKIVNIGAARLFENLS